VTQLRQRKEELEQLGVRVKIVTFDNKSLGQWYVSNTGTDWPILLDSNRDLYRGYGLRTGSWWTLSRPSSIWNYVKLIFAGHGSLKKGKDVRQLGGDVLIDPQAIVRMHSVCATPFDRPKADHVLDVVRGDAAKSVAEN
jgi:alkyl hydroperoxide reductase subunit AhpC